MVIESALPMQETLGLIPVVRGSPEGGNGNSPSISCSGKSPRTEESGELQSAGLKESDTTEDLALTCTFSPNPRPEEDNRLNTFSAQYRGDYQRLRFRGQMLRSSRRV